MSASPSKNCAFKSLNRGESGVIRRKTARVWSKTGLVLAAAVCLAAGASAQKTQNGPATDSSAQSSPIKVAPAGPVVDSSAQASPIGSGARSGIYVVPHTAIAVRLANAIDSGHLKNGDTVHATLTSAVALSPHGTLNTGTPAELTVVETLPAGRLYASGEFSLQLLRIGSIAVYTDTLTYRGKAGHKDLPDSAPQVGTDAGLASGAELTFHVLPPPAPANGPPNARNRGPGSVDGVTAGGPPPPGSSRQPSANGQNASGNTASSKPGSGKTSSSQARSVTSGSNTPQPVESSGKNSPAPNQPSAPANANSTDSTQPHL